MTALRRLVAIALIGLIVVGAGGLATGRLAHVTTNGDSMQPTYSAGDLVVIGRSASYDVGQIVAFRIPGDDTLVLHRIISGNDAGFTIQGDNNESIDPYQPTADEILGRELLHVPNIGALLSSPITRTAVLFLLLAVLGAMTMRRPHVRTDTAATSGAFPTSRLAWKVLIAIDVVLIIAVGMAQLAVSSAASSSGADGTAPTQTAQLAYEATVDRSDTYPTGVVATGDPVFTELVDSVDVTFDYATDPTTPSVTGTARLDAVYATSSGWHSEHRLVAPMSLESGRLELETTLVLADIKALADRVAATTGVPIGTVSVLVTASGEASLDGADPVPFSVDLPLALAPLSLTLEGETTDTPDGPAVVASVPFATTDDVGHDDGSGSDLRTALLVALLVAIAATVVLWPSTEDDVATTQALQVRIPTGTACIQVTDRSSLLVLATTTSRPLVTSTGWEGVLTADALYWRETSTPVPAAEPAHGERSEAEADVKAVDRRWNGYRERRRHSSTCGGATIRRPSPGR